MDTKKLAAAVRDMGATVGEIIEAGELSNIPEIAAVSEDLRDVKDLLGVLAHIVDGEPIDKAFGSPGDWGYGTPLGSALASKG